MLWLSKLLGMGCSRDVVGVSIALDGMLMRSRGCHNHGIAVVAQSWDAHEMLLLLFCLARYHLLQLSLS
jgi:hypothetical protein